LAVFTTSSWRGPDSAYGLDNPWRKISAMDIVAVLLALIVFAALLGLIYGIDRI
jgi:hypothetical protein